MVSNWHGSIRGAGSSQCLSRKEGNVIGVAVASQELHLVDLSTEKPLTLVYSNAGLQAILAASNLGDTVLIAGNKRWAKALAYALRANDRQVNYLSSPKQSRGAKQNHAGFVRKALEKEFLGRSFFREQTASPELHPDVVMGNDYFLLMNEMRRIKHRVINAIRLCFPEVLALGDKLWTKKRAESLRSCHWHDFELEIGSRRADSIAQFVPALEAKEAEVAIMDLMAQIAVKEAEGESLKDGVYAKTKDHPVAKFLGGSPTAHLVALFLGWRTWGTKRNSPTGFRGLRHFVGLDVSRMDAKGKMRISRSRPNVRTAIFWALKTATAKEALAPFVSARKEGGQRTSFVKRIERLLLRIWQECLKEKKADPAL